MYNSAIANAPFFKIGLVHNLEAIRHKQLVAVFLGGLAMSHHQRSITQCISLERYIFREVIEEVKTDLSISPIVRTLQPAFYRWLIKPAYVCSVITTCRYNIHQ